MYRFRKSNIFFVVIGLTLFIIPYNLMPAASDSDLTDAISRLTPVVRTTRVRELEPHEVIVQQRRRALQEDDYDDREDNWSDEETERGDDDDDDATVIGEDEEDDEILSEDYPEVAPPVTDDRAGDLSRALADSLRGIQTTTAQDEDGDETESIASTEVWSNEDGDETESIASTEVWSNEDGDETESIASTEIGDDQADEDFDTLFPQIDLSDHPSSARSDDGSITPTTDMTEVFEHPVFFKGLTAGQIENLTQEIHNLAGEQIEVSDNPIAINILLEILEESPSLSEDIKRNPIFEFTVRSIINSHYS